MCAYTWVRKPLENQVADHLWTSNKLSVSGMGCRAGRSRGGEARQIPPLLFDALPPGRLDFVHKESLQLMANSFSDRRMHVSIYTLVLWRLGWASATLHYRDNFQAVLWAGRFLDCQHQPSESPTEKIITEMKKKVHLERQCSFTVLTGHLRRESGGGWKQFRLTACFFF